MDGKTGLIAAAKPLFRSYGSACVHTQGTSARHTVWSFDQMRATGRERERKEEIFDSGIVIDFVQETAYDMTTSISMTQDVIGSHAASVRESFENCSSR